MGYYNEQTIRNCDAHTSDDDYYDRIDYGRTNNLNSARENVKNELNLKSHWNDTHRATLVKRPSEIAQDLIDTMRAAKITGNRAMFEAAQQQLRALVEQL